MYGHTLHRGKNDFCRYFWQGFSTEEILKLHFKDCFKINGTKWGIIPKKGKYVKFKSYERKIKSPFIIYSDFESIFLVQENNWEQNPEGSYRNKYKKNIACSYGYKLVCVDNKFSNPFKIYLGEYAVYNFLNNMMEESKYCIIKNMWLLKKTMKILRMLLNVRYVIMITLKMMLV